MKTYCSNEDPVLEIDGQYWRIVAASVTGARHEREQKPRQDVFVCGVYQKWIVAAICDGAGSAINGLSGAHLCSQTVVNELLGYLAAFPEQLILNEQQVISHLFVALDSTRNHIQALGQLCDFAATLIGVIAGIEDGIFFQIGDGVGVAIPHFLTGIDWHTAVIAPPENSEYINETYFFTDDDWREHLRLRHFPSPYSIFLMSDGVRPYAMDARCFAVEERFMTPLYRYLITESSASVAHVLAKTLGSTAVRRISDDDQTLVCLTRTNNERNDSPQQ